MKKGERHEEIDLLRGIGIICIILIHSSAYFLSNKVAQFLWNWMQWAVPVFVFCSTYLFFNKAEAYFQLGFVPYVKRRLGRLVKPYYIFLLFYFLVVSKGNLLSLNVAGVARQLTFTTPGTEVNWAILLFIYVMLLSFLLYALGKKNKVLLLVYGISALASSLYLLIKPSPYNFRLVMWLPWSLFILFTWVFAKYKDQKWFYPATLLTLGAVFLSSLIFLNSSGEPLTFVANKYPPNILFLSYGMLATTILYLIAKKGFFNASLIKKPLFFFSAHSYSIFFIHLLLIIAAAEWGLIKFFDWWSLFLVVLFITVAVQLVPQKMR